VPRSTPFHAAAAATLALLAAAVVAPLRAQTTAGPALAHEIKVTLHHSDETCNGGIVDWREEVTGWVGMPGTRAAYNARAEGDPAYAGAAWREVHASLCVGKCPDGECEDVCRFTVEATGPATLTLVGEKEGARLGIQVEKKYTVLRYGGGSCPDEHGEDQAFILFHAYVVPNLGFLPGDPSVQQLHTGASLPVVEELGDDTRVGTLEVLAGCNDRAFNPAPGATCGAPPAKKVKGRKG